MHLGHDQIDLNQSKTAKVKFSNQFPWTQVEKNIAAETFHLLLSETASEAERKWLACFEIIFAVGIKPAFWHERVRVVEVILVVSDSPRACVDLSLVLCQRLSTLEINQ